MAVTGAPNQLMMKHSRDAIMCFATTHPPFTSDEEKKKSKELVCILSAGNSISQNCTLGLRLERDGLAAAVISPVPRRAACL